MPTLPVPTLPVPTLPVSTLPVEEAEPLQQEAAGRCHPALVGAPLLQAIVGEAPEHVESLRGRDVPVPLLLDLREDPRLDQGASGGWTQNYIIVCKVSLHDN